MTKKLGRYELVEPLGQGGMGEVWLARLSGAGGFEKPAIVKTVLPSLAKDEQFVQRFHHEGKVLVHLSHSNIAQVYDMDQADGVLFMALEYVAGVDVSRLVSQVAKQDELIPVPVAVFIAWQAAEGLGYAHGKAAPDGVAMAIVHRDVSPQNVMISYEGEVKVIDFGIARSTARSHSTQAAMVMGKLGYMAPEQALAEPVDARADQYALAVLLWELLAGRHYIGAGTTPEIMVAMAQPKRQPLPPLRSEVDAGLDAVVQKALSRSPADRYPTTDDFARALLGELNRLGQPTRKQVGDWVKLKCSEAYETNQRLLSRLSTLSKLPAPSPTLDHTNAQTIAARGIPA
ncbi:MAG: serine/threonine protein kinase, partial [Myxococcaceae bacterium]|nr:serine/threonine protein kinase [Myxococcaceae bacterium]